MSTPLSSADFNALLGQASQALATIPSDYQKLVSNANSVAASLPGEVFEQVKAALRTCGENIAQLVEKVRTDTQPGDPFTLWSYGQAWTQQVGARASTWQDVFQPGQLKTDDEWSGNAAEKYKNLLPMQQKALSSVKAATDTVDTLLRQLSVAVGVMWVGVAGALVSFALELAAEAAAAPTVVGTLPAAGAVLLSSAKAVALVAALFGALEVFLTVTIAPTLTTLEQTLANNDGFPKGHWPKLTNDNDLSNASHIQNKGKNADWEMSKA